VQTHARDINIKLNINSEIKELANDLLVPVALIATLTEQLDGEVNRSYENGTKHAFTLKNLR